MSTTRFAAPNEQTDVLLLGGGTAARQLAAALAVHGLRCVILPDPLATLPGWSASRHAGPCPDETGLLPWTVLPGFTVTCAGPAGSRTVGAPALVVSMGARERLIPFPGHDLPGVSGLGGAALRPGERVLVLGPDPWRDAAHDRLTQADAAGIDLPDPAGWFAVAARPAAGGTLLVDIMRAAGDARTVTADRLLVADGFLPATDVFRLLQARLSFDAAQGAWWPALDPQGRTSLPGLYGLPDGPGVPVQVAALAEAVLGDWTGNSWPSLPGTAATEAGLAERLLDERVDALAPDRVVCPCEGITAGAIRAVRDEGVRHLNQLKSATRCGMGDCGGRLCEDIAARLLARAGHRQPVGHWTGRAPLTPLPMRALIGEYGYADIDIPAAAPL